MKRKLPRADVPCPHCGRPMERPVLERLGNPYCRACLSERRKAAEELFGKTKSPAEEHVEAPTLYG